MVNNVVLVGRITKDPEVKKLGDGTSSVCNFTLAVNRNFKNSQGDYDADFINCVVFNQVADLMERYVFKGHLLAVQGRIQTRNYDGNDGRKVYVTEVVANNVSFLESKRSSEENRSSNYEASTNQDFGNIANNTFEAADIDMNIDDDDLPF